VGRAAGEIKDGAVAQPPKRKTEVKAKKGFSSFSFIIKAIPTVRLTQFLRLWGSLFLSSGRKAVYSW
jgi:hypothetical protein